MLEVHFLDREDRKDSEERIYIEMIEITSRNRVLATLNHKEPDRVPFDLGATVVTHEKSHPNSKKRVLVPDVCNAFHVPYMDTFDLLECLNVKFQ